MSSPSMVLYLPLLLAATGMAEGNPRLDLHRHRFLHRHPVHPHQAVPNRARHAPTHHSLVHHTRRPERPLDAPAAQPEEVAPKALTVQEAANDQEVEQWIQELNMVFGPPSLMDAINSMRCNVCWQRPDIMHHTKCYSFLVELCHKGGVCTEVCEKFTAVLNNVCFEEGHDRQQDACEDYTYITGEKPDDGEEPVPAPAPAPAPAPEPEETTTTTTEPPADQDGDGLSDAEDDDIDGDGVPNGEDAFPTDPAETKDSDGDGVGDNADQDRDGDGVNDDEDAFPDDPEHTRDLDGDGIPDEEDDDMDGDGVPNGEDAFPEDPKETKDLDGDGIGDNADEDRDGDGHDNHEDLYPDDPNEWQDSDGDGVGDNADGFPLNPDCHDPNAPCGETESFEPIAGNIPPEDLNKVAEDTGLPEQGYNEHSPREGVEHEDKDTYVGDWREEWPNNNEAEQQSIERICKDNPQNKWCKRYESHGNFAR